MNKPSSEDLFDDLGGNCSGRTLGRLGWYSCGYLKNGLIS